MTGNPSVESSVEALRQGAFDYLPKPFSASHLQVLIGRAVHTLLVARETREQQDTLDRAQVQTDKLTLLGTAPAFRRAIELARKVAPTDASVFITGESGSGKEMIAQFIHHHSRRSSRPFVAVNCAALPEGLLESEMFGHRKGAFTGAVRDKPGLLEAAHGGTLFLDELVEMPKSIQAKLLRVIQDGVVRRVGSETTDAVVNVRFIAATNVDPEGAVKAGDMREDLYYRLRVVPINVPALRERPEDIPLLADYFLSTYWVRHRRKGAPFPRLTDAALRALCGYAWRGNVRELQNVIEHVAVVVEPGAEIRPEDLHLTGDPAGGELSRRPGPRNRPVRAAVPDVARQPSQRQHVEGRPHCGCRSDHVVPADGAPRTAAQPHRRVGSRARARAGGGRDGGGRGSCGRIGRAGRVIRGGVMEMRSNTAEQLDWPVVTTVRGPEPEQEQEPQDLTTCLAGPNGLDLVVELAHDLRSPLTSILFLAEALQQVVP